MIQRPDSGDAVALARERTVKQAAAPAAASTETPLPSVRATARRLKRPVAGTVASLRPPALFSQRRAVAPPPCRLRAKRRQWRGAAEGGTKKRERPQRQRQWVR